MAQNVSKLKASFLREVAAPSLYEAIGRLDDWGKSIYDMYLVKYGDYEERPGYIRITIWGWENDKSRETYDC